MHAQKFDPIANPGYSKLNKKNLEALSTTDMIRYCEQEFSLWLEQLGSLSSLSEVMGTLEVEEESDHTTVAQAFGTEDQGWPNGRPKVKRIFRKS